MSNLNASPLSDPTNKFDLSAEQQDTANLLERLLGKPIADRYVDFSRLSSGAFDLRVASPLAGHALRELDSILRQMLSIPLQAIAKTTEGDEARIIAASNALRDMGYSEEEIERATEELRPRANHKDQIRIIVTQLGLAESGDIARAWIAILDAHKKAHERPFNRSLEVDDEFRKDWADPFHMVVRGIAVALQGRYVPLMARVDELAAMTDCARALVLFKKEIPGAMSLQWHFFRSIHGPSWLPELIKRGLIAEPPYTPEQTKGQSMRQWPVGRYLLEMAKSNDASTRKLVAYALRQLADSKHPDVRRDALEIAAVLPPDEVASLSELIPRWLGDHDSIFGTHFAEEIMRRLASVGEKKGCLTVARGLYRLSGAARHIVTSFTPHMYEHSIFNMTSALTSTLGPDALKLFCDLLFDAAVITEKIDADTHMDHTTYSSLPLPQTEADQHDVYGALSGAVLHCSVQLIEEEKYRGEDVISKLMERPYRIYQRIALNALAKRPDAAPSVADALLFDPVFLESSSFSQEYAALAVARFPSMKPEKQKELLDLVDAVPDEHIGAWRERFAEHYKREPTEEDEREFVGATLRDLTWYWREVLPTDRQKALNEIVDKKGDPEAWREVFHSIEEQSPLDPSDFAAADVKGIADYLRSWNPGTASTQHTKTALAYELKKAVQVDPAKFSKDAPLFADLPPLYIRRLLEGLHQSIQNKATIEWRATIDLIETIIKSAKPPEPGEISQGGDDPTSFWAAKEAVVLLRSAFQRGNEIIGYEHAERLRQIIRLVEDIAPVSPENVDFEERYAQIPYFGAESTMFGLAAELNVLFLYWLSKQEKSPVWKRQRQAISLNPEFEQYARRALCHGSENGRIVRAVFGRYFSWLIHFGEEWVREQFADIFPQDQELRQAAWLGHLLSDTRPAKDFVERMRLLYEEEIARLSTKASGEERDRRADRCSEYLIILYLWGVLPRDLQDAFLSKTPARLRRHVMWFIGRELKSPDLLQDVRARALAYWEERLAAGMAATNKDEFREELGVIAMWDSMASIDVEWLLAQQIKMFGAGFTPSNAYSVVEWAAKVAPAYPDKTVEMIEALIANPKTDHWAYTTTQAPIRTVLTAGLATGNPMTYERVAKIVSYLASVGETGFLDLVKK